MVVDKFKVMEAYTRDVGRGIIRIDYTTMDKLKLSTGDAISATDKREYVAKAMPLYPSDEDKKLVRMDGLGRNNCGIAIGDKVRLKKVKTSPATKLIITPIDTIPPIDGRYVSDALESVIVGAGDSVMIPYFGGRLTFKVIGVEPKGHVLITQKTITTIVDKAEIKHTECPTCGQETTNPKLLWIMEMVRRVGKLDKNNESSKMEFIDYLQEAYDAIKK